MSAIGRPGAFTGAVAPPIVLTLSHFLGADSFFATDFARPWARELEARTGGRVRVELSDATSRFGRVTAQAAQVRDGTVDIALGLRGGEAELFPRTALAELPFAVPDAARGSRALWALFEHGAFAAEYEEFKVLALHVHNPGLIHTTATPVRTVDDVRGLGLRAPNEAVAAALQAIGAIPVILQVDDVMPLVRRGRIDGIVTNWGNPLPGFNDHMRFHTEVALYSSVFFVVMNRHRFVALPPDIQAAIEAQSGAALVARFGALWTQWDTPVRDGAAALGHEIIIPDAAAMAGWREAMRPVTARYLDRLAAAAFADAHVVHDRLAAMARR